jgi:glutamine synthetase
MSTLLIIQAARFVPLKTASAGALKTPLPPRVAHLRASAAFRLRNRLFATNGLRRRPAGSPHRRHHGSLHAALAYLMLRYGQPLTAEVCRLPACRHGNLLPHLRSPVHERPAMTKYKLEYIWLDGYKPVPNLRGKTQIKEFDTFPSLEELPLWGFDGSSTEQAEGSNSDCVLKPVAVFPDGDRTNGVLVMCEVMMPDGVTPHPSNTRAGILDDPDAWFGFEQEYFFYKDGRPLGFPADGFPGPQGPYYTGVGYKNVGSAAREIVDKHLDLCLYAGINHEGINAEVAKGQWEFQIFGKGSKTAADQMWMARYLMLRLCENYEIDIEWHCKPLGDTDWNGSGMHSNFSTKYMREVGGKEYFEALMTQFEKNLDDHIAVYGPDNHMRLTGKHETAPWNKFSYGVADRGASIRVPHSFVNNGYKGYLEDRRPNSQGDPYAIASQILKTVSEVPTSGKASAAA